MHFVWEAARKDLRRMLRDPAALLLWLAIPLLIAALLFLAFGGSEPRVPEAPLLVADHDRTGASRLLISALDQMPVIAADTVGEARGRARVASGRATALLVIPAGFQEAVLDVRPLDLPLVVHPAQRVLPGIVIESLDALCDLVAYAQRLLREPLRELRADLARGGAGGPSGAATERITAEMSLSAVRLRPYIAPPLLTLETRLRGDAAPQPGFGALFLPGLLFMTLLFVAEGLGGDLWRERSQGTLRRALASPPPLHAFLAGKLLAGAIVIAAICVLTLPVEAAAFGLSLVRLPLALAWSVFSGTVFLGGLLLIQLLASSQRTAGILTTMILFPLLMVGGSFFPFGDMPPWLERIGRATPNGWALTQLEAILRGSAGPADLLVPFAGLLGVGTACFALSARRLARGFAAGS